MIERFAVKDLPRVYWTVWVGTLVNKMGGVVVPFLALYLTRERSLSSGEAGLVVSLYGVGTFGAASVIAPIVGGAMLEGPGADVLWLGTAGMMTIVGLGQLALGPRLSRP